MTPYANSAEVLAMMSVIIFFVCSFVKFGRAGEGVVVAPSLILLIDRHKNFT